MITRVRLARNIFIENDSAENIKTILIKIICALIVLFMPHEKWYNASYNFYKLIRHVKHIKGNKNAFEVKRVYVLNQMLSLMTRTGISFYIPIEFNSNIENYQEGNLFCTSHMPLIKVGIKAMIENGISIDTIVAMHPTEDKKVSIWGMNDGIPALKADNNVLIKMRRVLLKKNNVALMVDELGTNRYSPNSMKICSLTKSKALFFYATLKEDGMILIELEYPPFPFCNSDFEIKENIDYLRLKTNRILEGYSNLNKS